MPGRQLVSPSRTEGRQTAPQVRGAVRIETDREHYSSEVQQPAQPDEPTRPGRAL
jgi:hypothetical protein